MALGSAAALNGETGRLIEHDHRIVAVQYRVPQHRFVAWRGLSRPLRSRCGHLLQGRNADGLTRRNAVTRAGALAVDSNPPGAQQPFEAAMAECGIVTLEPAVETNRPVLAGDGHGVGGFGHHPLRPSGGRGWGPSPAHRRCAGPTGAGIARAERGDGRVRWAMAGALESPTSPCPLRPQGRRGRNKTPRRWLSARMSKFVIPMPPHAGEACPNSRAAS